jgi:large subunit ribosomal protein L25
MPAVLYGSKTEPLLLSVNTRELEKALKTGRVGQVLINLTIAGKETDPRPVIIKELQTHPVTRALLHADFYEIDMAHEIKVSVPVVAAGKSKGVERGGLLQLIRRELEVSCLPNRIPDAITVDVTDLDIGDSLHVQEIPLEEGIVIPSDVNFTVVTVISAKVEHAEEEEAEEEAAEEAAEGETTETEE